MLEKDFQRQVVKLARLYRWRVAHFGNTVKIIAKKSGGYDYRPDSSGVGFPDLVLVRGGRLIFAELKSPKGKLRPEQREWMNDLLLVEGIDWFLWRPSDLQEIAQILK